MESVEIGTESTRARIIEKLFRMGYLEERGRSVEVTDLGMTVAEILEALFPELSSPTLTRQFEKMLEDIRFGRRSRAQVLAETRRRLSELIAKYNARLPMVREKLSYVLGAKRPPRTCAICGREAYGDAGGTPLCKLHFKAACSLSEKLPIVAERLGVTRLEALRKVAERRRETGRWVVEVASEALKRPALRAAIERGALRCGEGLA
jgi:DNA topoisomerase-1